MRTLTLLLLLFLSEALYAQTGEKNFIDQPYIEVTGKAELLVVPNQIYLKIILSEKDTKNKVSIEELEKQMMQKFKEIGLDINKEVFILDMSSNFKSYLLGKKDILLSKQYQVIVKDGKTAGRVFTELEKMGISNVTVDKLDNDHMDQYRQEVKLNAIKAAKAKAEYLTISIGQNIGKAIFIQELDMFAINNRFSNNVQYSGYINQESDAGSDIDFDKIKIEYAILCRFELK